MMKPLSLSDQKPAQQPGKAKPEIAWYRQFWPWFLFALPAAAVLGSLLTIYIAVNGQSSLVNDDYYKEGLTINADFARSQRAAAWGLQAELHFDFVNGEVIVQLRSDTVRMADINHGGPLYLELQHPFDQQFDQRIVLREEGMGRYLGPLDEALQQQSQTRYYLRLLGAVQPGADNDNSWELKSVLPAGYLAGNAPAPFMMQAETLWQREDKP